MGKASEQQKEAYSQGREDTLVQLSLQLGERLVSETVFRLPAIYEFP